MKRLLAWLLLCCLTAACAGMAGAEGELRGYSKGEGYVYLSFGEYPQTAEGEVLPVATKSFGGIGVFAIPEMNRFYRHVLIEGGYPHHGAVAFGHAGKAIFTALKLLGIEKVGFNQPAGMLYPSENPFAR